MMVRERSCGSEKHGLPVVGLMWLLALLPQLVHAEDEVNVQVRIIEETLPESVEMWVDSGELMLSTRGGARMIAAIPASERATITRVNGEVHVTWDGGEQRLGYVEIRPSLSYQVALTVTEGASERTAAYRGWFGISAEERSTSRALQIINHVNVEDYVASVVGAEYPFEEMEGVKAQAVLARTYALRSNGKYGENYQHTDHVRSQVYGGVTTESEVSREATELTRGKVLSYNGDLIEAVYSSTCGGHTANNEDVWEGSALPYLRGREDPYDTASPHSRWQTTVARSTLLEILSGEYNMDVAGFLLSDKSAEGRVMRVRLLGGNPRYIQANDFRLTINRHFGPQFLKSTYFTARIESENYVFNGRGFGHGVGMCQYGAREMANRGYSYENILGFYFEGTRLDSRDTPMLAADAPAPKPAPVPAARDEDSTPERIEAARDAPANQDDDQREEVQVVDREDRRESRTVDQDAPPTRRVGW